MHHVFISCQRKFSRQAEHLHSLFSTATKAGTTDANQFLIKPTHSPNYLKLLTQSRLTPQCFTAFYVLWRIFWGALIQRISHAVYLSCSRIPIAFQLVPECLLHFILFHNAQCISSCSRMLSAFHLVSECPLHFILFQNSQCIIPCILFCKYL